MAFVLTPRFAPAYQAPQCNPFGFCARGSRPESNYRIVRPHSQRPHYSSFNHFFGQVDELLSEIDREAQRQSQLEAERQAYIEAQREAHRQRQLRKRALRARFGVSQVEQGWHVDGDIQGFNQENISIEIIDENTLKIAGDTKWEADGKSQAEPQQALVDAAPVAAAQEQRPNAQTPEEKMDGVTLDEPDFETLTEVETATVSATTVDSDTESHKSYQATVEDDYEDLGVEVSSLISTPSTEASEPKEPKGKEKIVEDASDSQVTGKHQSQPDVPAQQEASQQEERVHGTFERTFRFPQRIDAANVSASLKEGALRISVPRAQVQQVKRIAIL